MHDSLHAIVYIYLKQKHGIAERWNYEGQGAPVWRRITVSQCVSSPEFHNSEDRAQVVNLVLIPVIHTCIKIPKLHFFLCPFQRRGSRLPPARRVFSETSTQHVHGDKENCPNGFDLLQTKSKSGFIKTKQCTADIILDSCSYFIVPIV